jgi:osmotically inducible protein OsmC
MKIDKKASAVWEGGLKEGKGSVSTASGALKNIPYGFNTRFGDTPGSNPEELIGAAHAGCFSMALSNELEQVGITGKIETTATITLEKLDAGFTVTKSHLTVTVSAPGKDKAAIEKAADGAKKNCPISKLLNAEISMDLTVSV